MFAVMLPASYAIQKEYQTGKIIRVEKKSTTRVLYYQVDTPITQDDPFYEITVQLGDTVYLGKYVPRHAGDTLPEEWNVPGVAVPARIEGHHLYLKRPSGVEMDLVIAKHTAVKPEPKTYEPAQK